MNMVTVRLGWGIECRRRRAGASAGPGHRVSPLPRRTASPSRCMRLDDDIRRSPIHGAVNIHSAVKHPRRRQHQKNP